MRRLSSLGLGAAVLAVMACSSEPADETSERPQTPEGEPTPELGPTPERPVADELRATLGDEGGVGIVFAGRVGLGGPVRLIEVELLDGEGEVFHQTSGWFPWLARPNRFLDAASVGHLQATADTFSGFMTLVDTTLVTAPRRVRVAFGERNELMGEWREAVVSPAAPASLELGERCDPFQVVSACTEGQLCDVPSGVIRDSPSCFLPPKTCPFEFPTLEAVYEGTNAEQPDDTVGSCTWSRGNLGTEQGHVFTAPQAGTYRFVAESVDEHAATTLFVRRYCDFAVAGASELGCAHEKEYEGGPIQLDVPLLEGQLVYVFVESWWVNGGNYRLSVEPRK
jgi:hypothetical protein